MSAGLLLAIILGYFLILLLISAITSRKADNDSFFLGNRKSPWYIVAFGMIGASLSGVTFISVPGWVGASQFSYMQMILGYLVGYFVIANVLIPLYYRLELTSIYTYLEERFGRISYKTGASFFLLSRTLGSAARLFLVANVLDISVFNAWNIPFWLTVLITIVLIWLYTFRGGIKTIIWTDTFQTVFMLSAVILTIFIIGRNMGYNFEGLVNAIRVSEYSEIFEWEDWRSRYHFVKQFLGGAFIAIVMTGLDQDMMQKNLSCRNVKDAKKNVYWMSLSLLPVNLLFLSVGALLFIFAASRGISIPANTDDLFPLIATGAYISPIVGVLFILGLIAAAFSSADSALTSLTTSFTIDILDGRRFSAIRLSRTRKFVHIMISIVMVITILMFKLINDRNVIDAVFTLAGYTYGPLLGLFSFGLTTKRSVNDMWVPVIAVLSPVICFILNYYSQELFNGYKFGFELLIVNGALTYLGLLFISRTKNPGNKQSNRNN
jgi:solute:Na+ symporter, SSS family